MHGLYKVIEELVGNSTKATQQYAVLVNSLCGGIACSYVD